MKAVLGFEGGPRCRLGLPGPNLLNLTHLPKVFSYESFTQPQWICGLERPWAALVTESRRILAPDVCVGVITTQGAPDRAVGAAGSRRDTLSHPSDPNAARAEL